MNVVTPASLSYASAARITWGVAWRSGIVSAISTITAFVLALPIGALHPKPAVGFLGGVLIGFGVGLCFQWLALRWLLAARIGKYRLQLTKVD